MYLDRFLELHTTVMLSRYTASSLANLNVHALRLATGSGTELAVFSCHNTFTDMSAWELLLLVISVHLKQIQLI